MQTNTFNGGYLKPRGTTATFFTMSARGCAAHDGTYTPFCLDCDYVETSTEYTLGGPTKYGGTILAFIVDQDGDLVDYVTADTYWETAVTMAGWGTVWLLDTLWNEPELPRSIIALMSEAELRADCFGLTYTNEMGA